MGISICPNCRCVTCPGCDDEVNVIRATKHLAHQIRIKQIREKEIAQRHIELIRKILGGDKDESSDRRSRD